MERNVKIVATIGPSSQDEITLSNLINAGLNVARLNFSHGTHEEHAKVITSLRNLSASLNKPITILQDLQGPKLRVGDLPEQGILLSAGQQIVLASMDSAHETNTQDQDTLTIPMDVPNLTECLSPGNHVLLDDGNLELLVDSIGKDYIEATVILGGLLKSHKGVNLPGARINIPSFTDKDEIDLAFGLSMKVDTLAISFVRSAQDIIKVREAIQNIDPAQADIPIIAKLERPDAILNLDEIIEVSDGVMVARGDLGVETAPSVVPVLQKEIIRKANQHNKTVITATQMLDSMINNPRPTRAEASDVANAVFDGTDAIMLSGETASGKYPIESVKMMAEIAQEAERHSSEWSQCKDEPLEPPLDDAISITRAARELAHDRNVSSIAVFTQSGRTALLMSKMRPRVPILAFTPNYRTYQKMGIYWGVTPFKVPIATNVEEVLNIVDGAIRESTILQPGEQVVMIFGLPVGTYLQPNLALLHTIGQSS